MEQKNILHTSAVQNYWKRFVQMDSARADMDEERQYTDLQVAASLKKDPKWKLLINIPIERVLLDINDGKYSWPVLFDVTGWQKNNSVEMTQPIFFALNDFLDKEWFYQQKMSAIRDKGQYWTMAWFTGIREDAFMRYEPKEVFNGLFSTDMKAIKRTEYKFTPLNRPINTVWIDDQACNTWDYRKADDAIIEEQITPEKAKMRYSSLEWFDVDMIKPYAMTDPYYNKFNAYPNQVLISSYYNKITSAWDVILNKTAEIYSWRYYHQWDIPVSLGQHFFRNNSPWWEGIPHRIRGMKWYKKSILQDILDASKMSAGINIIVPSWTEVNAQVGSWINVWTSTDAAGTQPVQFQTRIADMTAVLMLVDDMIIQDAGENVKAPYSSPKTTLGEIEFMEEKQQVRDRGIEQNLNICYDDILTKTAINLTKYAVNLIKTTQEWQKMKLNWEVIDCSIEYFPSLSIEVKDHVVEIKKWTDGKERPFFKQDFWTSWYFSLDKSLTNWEFMAKVVTPSTKMTNSIQKNSFTQAVANLQILFQTFTSMWIDMTTIKEEVNPQSVIEKRKELYEINPQLVAKTKKNEVDDAIKEEMANAQSIMGNDYGTQLLAPNTTDPNAQKPIQPVTPQAVPTPTKQIPAPGAAPTGWL